MGFFSSVGGILGLNDSGPGSVAPPDPYAVADAQAGANIRTSEAQTEMNRFNQQNPYGSQYWTRDPNNSNVWTQNTKLDPRVNNNLNAAIRDESRFRSGVQDLTANAENVFANSMGQSPGPDQANFYKSQLESGLVDINGLTNQAVGAAKGNINLANDQTARLENLYGTDLNYDNVSPAPTANEATRQSVADSLYGQSTSRLDPRFQQGRHDLETQLANQGITQGSDAYDREMANFGRDENDAYTSASNTANTLSLDAMQKLFGMEMASRQQGVGEANYLRDQTGKEASLANNLATSGINNALGTQEGQIKREAAIPAIASAMFNLDQGAYAGERMQALDEISRVQDLANSAKGASLPANYFNVGAGGGASVAPTNLSQNVYDSYRGDVGNAAARVGNLNNTIAGAGTLASSIFSLF